MHGKLLFQACAEASGPARPRWEFAFESFRGRRFRPPQSRPQGRPPRIGVGACVALADCLRLPVPYPWVPLGLDRKCPVEQSLENCVASIIQPPLPAQRDAFHHGRYSKRFLDYQRKISQSLRPSCRPAVGELSTKCKIGRSRTTCTPSADTARLPRPIVYSLNSLCDVTDGRNQDWVAEHNPGRICFCG